MTDTYVILTQLPPVLPNKTNYDRCIIVFDATIQGYRKVVEWLSKNQNDVAKYRLVIPYTSKHMDVGDYLCDDNRHDVKVAGTVSTIDSSHKFELAQINMMDKEKSEIWPFLSKNRPCDFEYALEHLENQILLPKIQTGLSVVQEYLLRWKSSVSLDVLIAMTSTEFHIPAFKVKRQIFMLKQGNLPKWDNSFTCIPNSLINGPIPISVMDVKKHIVEWINFKKETNWTLLIPSSNQGHVFHKCLKTGSWISDCKRDSTGSIIGLPYGVSITDFEKNNPNCNLSTVLNPLRFSNKALKLLTVELKWDGRFVEKTFKDQNEYMKEWLEITLQSMISLRVLLLKEQAKNEELKQFCRAVFIGKSIETRDRGKIRMILDEDYDSKRERIFNDWNENYSLLETPLWKIDLEFSTSENKPIPESCKDVWINEMDIIDHL